MSGLIRWQRPDRSVWPSVGRLFGLRQDLDSLFASPFEALAEASEFLRLWNPAVDVYEDTNNVFVKAELPGMKKEDIDVSLHDGVLNVSGERKNQEPAEGAESYRSER